MKHHLVPGPTQTKRMAAQHPRSVPRGQNEREAPARHSVGASIARYTGQGPAHGMRPGAEQGAEPQNDASLCVCPIR